MNIECPKCKEANEVPIDGIKCGKCEHDLSHLNFRVTKSKILTTTAAIIIGVAGVHQADKVLIKLYRLPMKWEYAVLEACVNGNNRLISSNLYIKQRDICLCAMEKTTEEKLIDYSESGMKEFIVRFKANTTGCR